MRIPFTVVLVCVGCQGPEAATPPPRAAVVSPTLLEPADAAPVPMPTAEEPRDAGADAAAVSRDPVRHREPLVLVGGTVPGPCVDPTPWLRQRHPDLGDSFFDPAGLEVDLDGDGVNDEGYFGGAARFETDYRLFVRRGDCAYSVGSVHSSDGVTALRARHHGLFDIRTSSDSCPLAERRGRPSTYQGYCETDWRFDGREFVPFAERKTKSRPAGVLP